MSIITRLLCMVVPSLCLVLIHHFLNVDCRLDMSRWHRKLVSRGLVAKQGCIIQTFSDTVSQIHTHSSGLKSYAVFYFKLSY